jgi:hypothetical protein
VTHSQLDDTASQIPHDCDWSYISVSTCAKATTQSSPGHCLPPNIMNGEQSIHFSFQNIQCWTHEQVIQGHFCHSCSSQAADLIEYHNGLLKQVKMQLNEAFQSTKSRENYN